MPIKATHSEPEEPFFHEGQRNIWDAEHDTRSQGDFHIYAMEWPDWCRVCITHVPTGIAGEQSGPDSQEHLIADLMDFLSNEIIAHKIMDDLGYMYDGPTEKND